MVTKKLAESLGFKLVQDLSTNLVHLASDETQTAAACNSRFRVTAIGSSSADGFACVRCLNKVEKAEANYKKMIDSLVATELRIERMTVGMQK